MLGLPVNPAVNAASPAPSPAHAMTPPWSKQSRSSGGRWLLILLLPLLSVVVLTAHPVHAAETTFGQTMSFGHFERTRSVAVGDLNGDGLLDIVQGNAGDPSYVYLNNGQGGFRTPALALGEVQGTMSVAVGDLNGDGFLDIIQGNNRQPSYIYFNDGQGGFRFPALTLGEAQNTMSVAVGDLNGDGFLDIIQGNQIGDLDGDFIIDEVEVKRGTTYVYLNDGQGGFPTPAYTLGGIQSTYSVALGDLNDDGFLDIVQGNTPEDLDNNDSIDDAEAQYGVSYVYLNDGQGGFPTPAHAFGSVEKTQSVAVGDLNGDGFLDIVQGNNGALSYAYLNDRQGSFGSPDFILGPGSSYVAVGDLNGDGFLDIIQGNNGPPSYIYLNNGYGGFNSEGRVFGNAQRTASVAVGDFNNDSFLDVVRGNSASPSYVYLNDGQGGFDAPDYFLQGAQRTEHVALGDLNGDGFLDIVQGNYQERSYIYLSDRQRGFPVGQAIGDAQRTNGVAVGDLNGDGFLDIVQGNADAPSYVFLNDRQGGFSAPGQVWGNGDDTQSIAMGDFNGDGFLDLVQGKYGLPSYLFLNNGQGGFDTPAYPFGERQWAGSLATGDFNGDGLLDIVQGNRVGDFNRNELMDEEEITNAVSYVYLNDGQGGFVPRRALGGVQNTFSVATGDFNGDGFLDIAQGNEGSSYIYLNDGQGNFGAGRALSLVQNTTNLTVGDLNGDGFLDLVQAYFEIGQNYLYLNDGQGNFGAGRPYGGSQNTMQIALGDLNGDGLLDLVQGNDGQWSYVYLNSLRQLAGRPNHSPQIAVTRPGPTGNANFYSTPAVLSSPTIPITYTLFDPERDPVGRVEASYSLDGGGKWLPAVAVSTTVTNHLATSPTGVQHVYSWDTFASGVFGQSDNVVLRLVAYSQPLTTTQPITGSYRYTNSAAGATQWATVSATTFPFRVRGTQVRVVDQAHKPLADALVYRLLAGQFSGATPLADAGGQPFRTDAQGYLGGRGALQVGDGLVALLPMTPTHPLTFTQQYSYFLTSAPPNINGLTLTELSQAGVVTLTVPTAPLTNTHPLMLFNLTVSLEWDASGDDLFQAELENGFKRASELLFKVTHGQAALNRVDVFPAKSFWNRADLILYANNSLRPSAAIGGVVKAPIGEIVRPAFDQPATKSIANAYLPGQIRMGVSWDPFGEEAGDLSEQWWRALAHELSHHLFFLLDDYVGFKMSGTTNQRFLGRVDCQGSFMTTTFDPSYTRFLDRRFWTGDCEKTIAAFSTGRNDWETIKHFYPMLKAPPNDVSFKGVGASVVAPDGPNLLPLDVTHLVFWQLPDRRPTLPARYFQLRDERKKEIIRLPTAQVYLFQTQGNADPTDDVLLALGSPTGGGDRIKVRGGQPDDRLCLFDFGASDGQTYTGCIGKLSAADVSIPVRALYPVQAGARWAPAIDVRALTTRTLVVTVTQTLPISTRLNVQVFPAHYPSAPGLAPVAALTLTQGVYVGQVALPYPASDVLLRVWVDDGTNLEAISQFNLQLPWKPGDPVIAGPNTIPMGGPNTMPMGGPNTMPMGGTDHPVVGGAPHYRFAAPALSADAQVVIYNAAGIFEPNGIQSLQILPSPPEVEEESWLVPVGQAYFVQPDPTLAAKRAIAITYLQRDVPEGYEHTLTIYYLRQGDKSWQRLATQQFVENLLVADLQVSAGTYAVMSTVMLPALSSGLNLVTYPLPDTRPITTALASLAGQYSELYEVGPNGKLLLAPQQLVFGHTYVIQIESKEPVYLYLAPPRRLPNGGLPGEP